MDAQQGKNAGTQFGTHHVYNLVHGNNSQKLPVYNNNNSLSLENNSSFKKTKSPREIMQRALIGAEGLEQDATDPRKQGLFDNADNASPQFCPQSNYFEQILTLFDQLPIEEQERILSLLEARIKTSVK